MAGFAIKSILPVAAGVALALAGIAESAAMPVDVALRSEAVSAGAAVDVKYIPKRRVVRRGDAAAAAAFGAMALGIGAAIAADRRNDYYYGYGYPAYGYPAYGYGYAPGYYGGYYRPRYYAPRYYGRPVYRGFR